jgi:hypothetical protein
MWGRNWVFNRWKSLMMINKPLHRRILETSPPQLQTGIAGTPRQPRRLNAWHASKGAPTKKVTATGTFAQHGGLSNVLLGAGSKRIGLSVARA